LWANTGHSPINHDTTATPTILMRISDVLSLIGGPEGPHYISTPQVENCRSSGLPFSEAICGETCGGQNRVWLATWCRFQRLRASRPTSRGPGRRASGDTA